MGFFSKRESYSSAPKPGEKVFTVKFKHPTSGNIMVTDIRAKSASEARQKVKASQGDVQIISCI